MGLQQMLVFIMLLVWLTSRSLWASVILQMRDLPHVMSCLCHIAVYATTLQNGAGQVSCMLSPCIVISFSYLVYHFSGLAIPRNYIIYATPCCAMSLSAFLVSSKSASAFFYSLLNLTWRYKLAFLQHCVWYTMSSTPMTPMI